MVSTFSHGHGRFSNSKLELATEYCLKPSQTVHKGARINCEGELENQDKK